MDHGVLSLVPPLLALLMVILTKKVLLSLGIGIIVGALMVNQGEEMFVNEAMMQVLSIVTDIFYVDGGVNTWEFYILLFLLTLGMIASFITLTGGSRAFGEWALKKVKTRTGAQFTSGFLGILIFIDDYFNSLTVGNISRPFTDRHKISRAKLAYVVDSTAAPICVISPVSSWGAYIITIIGGILVSHGVTQYEALQAFIMIAPMNFYAIFAILLVFAVAYYKLDFGLMKLHEDRAMSSAQLVDPEKGAVPGESEAAKPVVTGKVGDLIWPIVTLIVATVFFMIFTGIQGTEGEATVLSAFENTDVAASLLYGGLISLVITVILAFIRRLSFRQFGTGVYAGIQSMLPAIYILIFAWTIIEIIDELGTGEYLAGLVNEHIHLGLLPALLFLIAGVMAFSTGTSWGTFGIMLPIAGDIAAATDISMILPVLAAVLAGSIFGDHCSPISDTTILSSTGAGSHHIDHVLTQLPYALLVGVISIAGFLALGFTGSVLAGLALGAVLFILIVIILRLFTAGRTA
ncbi:Na+/H+ antiporter NhaC family protein [Salisediminibacterium halotolerans]|uniref:Tetracycline resistance efflux pump n=1 Tax=Salisediminibacterium halotolerans TaxID=517425 RepID=A0A1H9VM34_9BACI|nr:Na+/H+ antiporter NhaC family protein [Salisediminibacterium haloalkalitolerans]SES22755.1 tetracycline resistance efflux pump [Salisediminibacterium haloalkalitolerans]